MSEAGQPPAPPAGDPEASAAAPAGDGAPPEAAPAPYRAPHHFWRMFAIWAVLSAAADPLFYFLVGPHVPPGAMTDTASGQQFDFNVLFLIALPVILGVWVYMAYALINWRASRPRSEPTLVGAPARSHLGVQVGWILSSTVLVLGVFAFGLVELVVPPGAGGGEGPVPLWTPTSHNVLTVQVIAQQWKFTYRYPSFGGFETTDLILPDDTTIAFDVTSLDVVHSFWAYQLGVKADANPDVNNIAYTTTRQDGTFLVECAELCGLWHGAMYNYGQVVPKTQFASWAASSEVQLAAATKLLPPFAYTYTPDANGADGGYYPDSEDPYSNVEVYGASPAS
jgi:cytochrome c oxidase subunit II